MDRRSVIFLVTLAVVSICVLVVVAAAPLQSELPLGLNQMTSPKPLLQNAPPLPGGGSSFRHRSALPVVA